MSLFEPLPKVDFETWLDAVESDLGADAIDRLSSRVTADLVVAPLYADTHECGSEAETAAPLSGPCQVGIRTQVAGLEQALSAIADARAAGAQLLWLEAGGRTFAESLSWTRVLAACIDDSPAPDSIWSLIIDGESSIALPASLDFETRDLGGRSPMLDVTFASASESIVDLARWCLEDAPSGELVRWRSVLVDTEPHRAAGADAIGELAVAVAGGMEAIRRLVDAGMAVGAAARQVQLAVTVGRDVFLEVAKLRALRRLWWRAMTVAGAAPADRAVSIIATSPRNERTVYGPFVNQLRATAEAFAAQVGGADGLVLAPFDLAGAQGSVGSRLVATTQHVAAQEAHLGRVGDPAAGSYYVEALTDRLARLAWQRARGIERAGGLGAVIEDGSLGARYKESREAAHAAIRDRRDGWVGSNLFASLDDGSERASFETDREEALYGPRPTSALEGIRLAVDRLAADQERPRAEILGFGAPAVANALAADAARALAAGGIASSLVEEVTDEASIVVLCGDPEALDLDGVSEAKRLIARGCLVIVGAAATSDAWSSLDVERLEPRCDLVALLASVARRAGATLGPVDV